MKKRRVVHSHTKNYVLCFVPHCLFPQSVYGEECPLTVECGRVVNEGVHDGKQSRWAG